VVTDWLTRRLGKYANDSTECKNLRGNLPECA
jgi:hypothetical protein